MTPPENCRDGLVRITNQRTWLLWGLVGAALFYSLGTVAVRAGISQFSPDSWSYFELAKTVFTKHFYEFSTKRSYIDGIHSASFPLGYPLVLWVFHRIFGVVPQMAVYVNVCASLLLIGVINLICRKEKISWLWSIALSLSVLGYYGFFEEIASGRSMPVALLLLLFSVLCIQGKHGWSAGLFAGWAALCRFDYLSYSFLVVAFMVWKHKKQPLQVLGTLGGYVFGLMPWVVYSKRYFDMLWASDNSWVAMAAQPAFVLDFPVGVGATATTHPWMWLQKILGYSPVIFASILAASLCFPCLLALCGDTIKNRKKLPKVKTTTLFIIYFALVIAVFPYMLTGYGDQRYFLPIVIAACFALLVRLRTESFDLNHGWKAGLCLLAIIISAGSLIHEAYGTEEKAQAFLLSEKRTRSKLESLAIYHRFNPHTVLVFSDHLLGCRYGALTGMPAALLPSNIEASKIGELEAFQDAVGSFILAKEVLPCEEAMELL